MYLESIGDTKYVAYDMTVLMTRVQLYSQTLTHLLFVSSNILRNSTLLDEVMEYNWYHPWATVREYLLKTDFIPMLTCISYHAITLNSFKSLPKRHCSRKETDSWIALCCKNDWSNFHLGIGLNIALIEKLSTNSSSRPSRVTAVRFGLIRFMFQSSIRKLINTYFI